jgi:hypothetical protein
MASLGNINSYFLTRRNQFENNIFARFWTTDPFAGLIESKPFELEMGLTPTVVTATHELPTSYLPLTQTALTLSAGTGNAACTPGVINIGGGYITRNFTINVNAFQTEAFCLTDLQFKFQWEQQARFREKGLGDFVTQYQGDWARVNNIGQVNTKVMPLGPGLYAESDNDANFSFVNLAPYVGQCGVLDWTMLANFYDRLNQIGAQQNSVGMSDGTPVYALNIGPGLKRRLFQTTSFIRTSVDFNDMGKEFSRNFLARGIDTAINGFLPNVDLNAIRYDAGFNPIYPYVNNQVTQGTQAQPNPNYRTVALGGKAVYEAFSIMARGVYSKRPRPIGPLQAGLEGFNPVTYSGEVRWLNNPDMSTNILGNYGLYRIDIQQAAMPEFPELAFTGICLAIDGN